MKASEIDEQFECFCVDCLIPSTKVFTRNCDLWELYKKYCQAVDQMVGLSAQQFYKRIRLHYMLKTVRGYRFYGVEIREGLFVTV